MMNIGFIGLGIMASRMAAHLHAQGHALTVYNRTQGEARDLLGKGATWAGSPAAAARSAGVLITMLAHPEAVEAAAVGPAPGGAGGLFPKRAPGLGQCHKTPI